MRCWEMVLDWISSLALDLAEHLGLEILQRAFYLEKETVAYEYSNRHQLDQLSWSDSCIH